MTDDDNVTPVNSEPPKKKALKSGLRENKMAKKTTKLTVYNFTVI